MCDLYPDELYQLHCDLDAFANGYADEEVYERLPLFLAEAEVLADSLLEDHLRVTLNKVGRDEYFRLLVGAASDDAKLLYALRCFIASSGIAPKPDRIEIYYNYKAVLPMESSKDYQKAFDTVPDSGCLVEVVECGGCSVSERDVLPWDMLPRFRDIFDGFGLEVSCENVWGLLSECGRRACVRDRIIGRLLYLVENARSRESRA